MIWASCCVVHNSSTLDPTHAEFAAKVELGVDMYDSLKLSGQANTFSRQLQNGTVTRAQDHFGPNSREIICRHSGLR